MRLMTLSGPTAMAKALSVTRSLSMRGVVAVLLCLVATISFTVLSPSAAQARTYGDDY